MELKIESMENMKKAVAKCLDELMQKNDLTPAETKAAIDGLHLYDELCCRVEEDIPCTANPTASIILHLMACLSGPSTRIADTPI